MINMWGMEIEVEGITLCQLCPDIHPINRAKYALITNIDDYDEPKRVYIVCEDCLIDNCREISRTMVFRLDKSHYED